VGDSSAFRAQCIHLYLNRKDFEKARALADKFLAEAGEDDPQRKAVEEIAALIPPPKK
jgi:hypothetical protein